MTPQIRYYRDQSSQPRVQTTSEFTIPGDYLASDLQETATTEEVLAALEKISSNDEQKISGNSYSVTLSADQVVLESLFDEEQDIHRLPVPTFQGLLTSWNEFLGNDQLISLVPEF